MNAAFIIGLIDGVARIMELINKWITTAKQNKELTEEEEAALDKKMAEAMQQPWWKPKS